MAKRKFPIGSIVRWGNDGKPELAKVISHMENDTEIELWSTGGRVLVHDSMLKPKREIWNAFLSHTEAEQCAQTRRQVGVNARIYERTLRAEGLACNVYVVVCDAIAGPPYGVERR